MNNQLVALVCFLNLIPRANCKHSESVARLLAHSGAHAPAPLLAYDSEELEPRRPDYVAEQVRSCDQETDMVERGDMEEP